jgi:pilus assembly protein CpaB
MRVSRVVLLLVALLAGGLAAFLATRGGPPPVETTATQVVQEARTQILVAKTAIGMGERLSPDNLEWQDWPVGAVRPEYVTIAATPAALTDMKGTVARFEFFPGEPIREQKLVHADQGYLSAVLDKGMRGVSIAVTADSASGGFIVPNDHVDVVLTRSGESGDTSETILHNVRVLAINTRLGELGATGAPTDPSAERAEVFASTAIATLELSPGQGETIINATSLGKLSLALRSIVDFKDTASDVTTANNQPIRVVRFGQQTNVTAGAGAESATADAAINPASFAQPISISPGAAAMPLVN